MSAWIKTEDRMPENGQEVTALMDHGQIRQIVRDINYSGGWKQVNCRGWECVSFDPRTITHWRPDVFERPTMRGPKDAPWMLDQPPKGGGLKMGMFKQEWRRFSDELFRSSDAPYPGMIEAFEKHYGQSWTDREWRDEARTWAAAWKAAVRHADVQSTKGRD